MNELKFKIVSVLLGLLLSVFLGELVARCYFFGIDAFSYSKVNSFGILSNSGIIKHSKTKGLIYELLPNLNTKYKLFDFKTNKEGFRDYNHSIISDSLKVAVIGDSFTMGTGVKREDMFVVQTAKRLNNRDNRSDYEFLNFGVSGYSLKEYKILLEKNVLKYKPNLIVIGFCASNDHYEPNVDFSMKKFVIAPKVDVFWNSYLKILLRKKLTTQKSPPIFYSKKNIEYINSQFQNFQEVFKKNKIKGLVFYMDLIYDANRVSQIQMLAKKNDLLFLDVSELFKEKNLSKFIVNELDPHPNGKANHLFADKLSNFILANNNEIFIHVK